MPTYDYRCAKCGNDFEVFQSFSDEPLKKHPGCGGKVTKVMSAAGIVLKGSGFYKTDSSDSARSKSKQRSQPATTSSETKTGSETKESGSKRAGDSPSTSTGDKSSKSTGDTGSKSSGDTGTGTTKTSSAA